jgi:hypothetical protein
MLRPCFTPGKGPPVPIGWEAGLDTGPRVLKMTDSITVERFLNNSIMKVGIFVIKKILK